MGRKVGKNRRKWDFANKWRDRKKLPDFSGARSGIKLFWWFDDDIPSHLQKLFFDKFLKLDSAKKYKIFEDVFAKKNRSSHENVYFYLSFPLLLGEVMLKF